MAYAPKFTTKTRIYAMVDYIDEDETIIPDDLFEIGEDMVIATLAENGKYDVDAISYSDYRLRNAATYYVLYILVTNPVVRGLFSQSGEIVSKGAVGIQTIFSSNDRGGTPHVPQEIDRKQQTPNYWNMAQYWIQLYLKDPKTGGKRIDQVTMMASNMNQERVKAMITAKQFNAFDPKR